MAGDWIKVETNTPEKPEILAVSGLLDLDPDMVFGKCFKLWRWFDQQTENGNAPSVTKALLDRYLCVPGFCDALENVGWLASSGREGAVSVSLPNFDRHNGQTAKRRALTAKRKAKCSAKKEVKNGNAPSVTTSSLLFSYSFLLSNKEMGLPENLRTPQFEEAWDAWVKHRSEIKKKLTATSVGRQLRKFSDWGPARASTALLYTIEKGWQGVREPENGATANAGSGDQRGDAMSRDEVRRQSRRAAIVKAGRKAGLDEAEIEGQLQAEGLEL